MTTPVTARWRAAMNTRLLNDAERETVLAGILKAAPASALMAIPSVAASYAALVVKGPAFTSNVATAAANEKVYLTSAALRDASRVALDLELSTFKTLVDNNATTAGDVIGTGLRLLVKQTASRTPPDPPGSVIVLLGKTIGTARVVVAGKGYLGTFAAQISPDPVGPTTWVGLPGNGKERKLSGYASGTKVWVRFALVRFGMQSNWSVPVLVTFP